MWDDYRPRIRPEHGIRARTQRGPFGQTWWAGRWIAALERLGEGGRLARGRTYARGGQVVTLEAGTHGVAAQVQGSQPRPYKVSIRFRTLTDAEWERVIAAMAAQAINAARLLSGEMPEQIEEIFEQAGTSLLPANANDLITDCSCPDWSNPCKHTAAVHYLLGERFDDDPFLMFELRGRTKEALLTALRERRGSATMAQKAVGDAPELSQPLPVDPAAFWTVDPDAGALPFSFEAPSIDALPVKRLGPPPFWPEEPNFTMLIEQIYQTIGAYAEALIVEPAPEQGSDARHEV